MRKTFVTAFVALLAVLAVVSCDSILTGEKPEYTADGRRLVTLSVNTGVTEDNSRSLTDTLAKQQDRKWVEVIFRDTAGDYWRGEGYLGVVPTIKIPVGDYYIDDAVLLIGKKSDGTLLATGTLTGASLSVAIEVKDTTTTISFTAVSLVSDIHAGASSNFDIVETSGTPDPVEDAKGGVFQGKTKLGQFDSQPCFQVPTEVTGIEASLSFTAGFAGTGVNIFVNGTPKVNFNNLSGPVITPTGITPADTDPVGTGKIEFKFSTPALPADTLIGEYIITFNIPVVAYDPAIDDIITWNIRAGTKTGMDFTGGGEDGVVLLVADSLKRFANVGITTPGYPNP